MRRLGTAGISMHTTATMCSVVVIAGLQPEARMGQPELYDVPPAENCTAQRSVAKSCALKRQTSGVGSGILLCFIFFWY